jgi:hypothetical protein
MKFKAPTPNNLTAPSGQSFGDYWTVITSMSLVLFVFYVANEGLLSRWLGLFAYAAPAQVQSAGSSASGSGGVAGAVASELGVNNVGDGSASAIVAGAVTQAAPAGAAVIADSPGGLAASSFYDKFIARFKQKFGIGGK